MSWMDCLAFYSIFSFLSSLKLTRKLSIEKERKEEGRMDNTHCFEFTLVQTKKLTTISVLSFPKLLPAGNHLHQEELNNPNLPHRSSYEIL